MSSHEVSDQYMDVLNKYITLVEPAKEVARLPLNITKDEAYECYQKIVKAFRKKLKAIGELE